MKEGKNMATAIELTCSKCGATMEVTDKATGKVTCPYCHNESVIDGLVKNSQILEKENINSGVSMTLTKPDISNAIFKSFDNSIVFPLDIFDKGAVYSEEHLTIPSYLFYCNGMASFNYEAGVQKERLAGGQVKSNGKVKMQTETYTEWTPMSGATNASAAVFAPGSRELSNITCDLYYGYDANKLVDVEELSFPADVKPYTYNIPAPAAFNEYAKPVMERKLRANAETSLANKQYRNLSLGGCQVQKDDTSRVTLGVYKLGYQYGGANYTLYVTGDGSNSLWETIPVDAERKAKHDELTARQNKLASKRTGFLVTAIICLVLAWPTSGISLIGTALFGYFWFKRKSDRKKLQEEFDAFVAQANNAKNDFVRKGTLISGL